MCENTSTGAACNEVEDLNEFGRWLQEETVVPFPSCLKEPPPSNNSANKNPPGGGGGGSQRSRMFVNSNREHGGKPKSSPNEKSDKKENNPSIPSNSLSWDTPMLPESVPKLCLTNSEFAAAVRAKKEPTPDENSTGNNNDNCPHFIIDSKCYCDATCIVGVCTNCFLVFCNPNCLKGALRRGGKVADVAKDKLDKQPFGFSRQNFSKPFVSEASSGDNSEPPKITILKREVSEAPKAAPASSSTTKTASTSSGAAASNAKPVTVERPLGENKKTKPGRGRGRGTLPFGSETTIVPQPLLPPKSSAASFRGGKRNAGSSRHANNPPNPRPTGIFSHSHGYRESYGEMISSMSQPPPSSYGPAMMSDAYELGGKGHFDMRSCGGPTKLFPHEEFPSTSSLVVGRSVGRGRGIVRLPENTIPSVGYSLHSKPIEPLIHNDKILRDPVATYFGARSDASVVPVYRGQSTVQPFTGMSKLLPGKPNPFLKPKAENSAQPNKKPKAKKSPKGGDSQTVRLHGNVEVELTTPMKGAYDRYDDSNRRPFTETDGDGEEGAGLTGDSEESVEMKSKWMKDRKVMSTSGGSEDELEERDVELLRLQPKTGLLDSADDSESKQNRSEDKSVSEEVRSVVSTLWDEMDRIEKAEVEDALVTSMEDHELNGLTKELESLSMGNRRSRRPIDEEMQVPLGVFVVVRPTCVVDANRMYLRWEDEKAISRTVEMGTLQKIDVQKMECVKVGDYCVVQYEGDILNNSGRQRAQVVRVANSSHSTVKVRLIDIGLEDEMSPEGIFVLPQKFLSQRRLCFRFGLLRYLQVHLDPAVNDMQDYLQKALALYTTAIRVDAYLAAPVDRTRHWGEMFCFAGGLNVRNDLADNTSVTECTAEDRLRKYRDHFVMTAARKEAHQRNNFEVEDAQPVYLCPGATSFNNFFVIRMSELDIKTDVEDRLDRYGSLTLDPYSPWEEGVGDLCLAIVSSEKTELFRAQVAYIDGGEAVVRLLDTGLLIKTTLDSLREMPQTLRDIQSLALACSLPVIPVAGKASYSCEVLRKLDRLNVVLAENVQVIAHVLRPITPSKFEVELAITPKNREISGGISFSESLVHDGGAVWASEDFRRDVLYPYILERELPHEESSSDSSTENEAAED